MAGLFGFLFALGLLLWLLPWLAVLFVIGGAVWLLRRWMLRDFERDETRRREHRAISGRADRQHAWALAGDPRGVFGEPVADSSVAPVRREVKQAAPVVRRSVGRGVTVRVTVG